VSEVRTSCVAHLVLHGPKAACGEPQQRRLSEPCLAGDARCASRREGSLTPREIILLLRTVFSCDPSHNSPTPAAPSSSAARSFALDKVGCDGRKCERVIRHCLWPFRALRVTRSVQVSYPKTYELLAATHLDSRIPQVPASAA